MTALRAVWRLIRAALHVLHGVLIAATLFHRLDDHGRAQRVQWWSIKLLRMMGVELVVTGLQPRPGAVLIVANHISWLDIMAINAVRPVRFISKVEVRNWPVLGWLVTVAGTLYIERASRRDAVRVVHSMAAALAQGDALAVFPEGTTSDGSGLLPFHGNLLQAAISTETPVQPVALRYSDPRHAVSPAVAFIGDITLMQSLWMVVNAKGLRVHVHVMDSHATAHADRRALAAHLQEQIKQQLQS